jgi:DivIVA domain-containing protein
LHRGVEVPKMVRTDRPAWPTANTEGDPMKNDLDVPLLPSAEQIRRREFATVRRGYDPDQVRDYLKGVASQVETLEREVRERKKPQPAPSPGETLAAKVSASQAEAAPPTTDAYEQIAKRFAGVLEAADKEATGAVAAAQAEATKIVHDARAEADRIQLDAQARAEAAKQEGSDALASAKREADRILGSLNERRESLMSQMHDMQAKLLSVAKDLETSIDEDPAHAGDEPAGRPGTTSPDEDAIDPRYEDMWALPKGKHMVDIPDLASLDVDFDEERRSD